jgi:mRNA interferase RelE/StbE
MGSEKEYSLKYHRLVSDDISGLDSFWFEEIRISIESKLLSAPEIFGKPLRQSLKGCRSLRVGDYRVVYRIERRIIRIIAIVHRSENYKSIEKRI